MQYSTWLKAASVVQVLLASFHALSLFANMQGQNETENQLITLMETYVMDLGFGFERTMSDLFTALSACLSLINLLGATVNFYLLKKVGPDVLKGYLLINVILFGVVFAMMVTFTFIMPIAFTGLIFLLLLLSYVLIPTSK